MPRVPSHTYTIGQLARAGAVPTSTVRFYEREGLLKAAFRTGGNYRAYDRAAVERLRFIRTAQATGLSLQDVRSLLELAAANEPPCRQVTTLMRRRLGEVRERLDELRQVEQILAKSLDNCCKGDGRDLCVEVCRLNSPGCCTPSRPNNSCAAP